MVTSKLTLAQIQVINAVLLQYIVISLLPGSVKAQLEDDLLNNHSLSQNNHSLPGNNSSNSRHNQVIREIGSFLPDEDDNLPTLEHKFVWRRSIPRFFDARWFWTQCAVVIDYRRDQGNCSSCWAQSTAAIISDRICIGSGASQHVYVSSEDLITCCSKCTGRRGKCKGGSGFKAFKHWKSKGVVSGGGFLPMNAYGRYDINQGCKPLSDRIYNKANAGSCVQKCSNPLYRTPYENDKTYAKLVYKVTPQERQMQLEILNHGPIGTFMNIYEDYRDYTSGIYQHERGKWEADHFVKIIGWGTENRKKYWLLSNSYGRDWGENEGLFRILRGINHCNIEKFVRTGRLTALNDYREGLVSGCFICKKSMPAMMCPFLLIFLLLNAT